MPRMEMVVKTYIKQVGLYFIDLVADEFGYPGSAGKSLQSVTLIDLRDPMTFLCSISPIRKARRTVRLGLQL